MNSKLQNKWDAVKNGKSREKLRRSQRLKERISQILEKKANYLDDNSSALGYFQILPEELLHNVLSYVSINDLGVLTICSKEVRDMVEVYQHTTVGYRRFLPNFKEQHHNKCKVVDEFNFKTLGVYLKRVTCLNPTKERMNYFIKYLEKLHSYFTSNRHECVRNMLKSYGILLHSFLAGWEESECIYVHNFLEIVCHMNLTVSAILESLCSSQPLKERYVRQYYNNVYIRTSRGSHEQAFWLTQILKPKPIIFQAKLIYIIFGPVDEEEKIHWGAVTDPNLVLIPQSYQKDMASCFFLLQNFNVGQWNEDDIVSIFEDLTGTPTEWLKENVANLLFLCGAKLAKLYLVNKIINGRIEEVAECLAYMALVCSRHKYNVTKIVNLVILLCQVLQNRESQGLLQAIPQAFRHLMLELHEGATIDHSREHDFRSFLLAQHRIFSLLFAKLFTQNNNKEKLTFVVNEE